MCPACGLPQSQRGHGRLAAFTHIPWVRAGLRRLPLWSCGAHGRAQTGQFPAALVAPMCSALSNCVRTHLLVFEHRSFCSNTGVRCSNKFPFVRTRPSWQNSSGHSRILVMFEQGVFCSNNGWFVRTQCLGVRTRSSVFEHSPCVFEHRLVCSNKGPWVPTPLVGRSERRFLAQPQR